MAARATAGGGRPARGFYQELRERLIAHGRQHARLERRAADGHSEREHLEAVHRATGRMPAELEVAPLAPAIAGLWNVYTRLRAQAGSSGFGPAPVTLADLVAFEQLYRVRLSPWEADTLLDLDAAVLAEIATEEGAGP